MLLEGGAGGGTFLQEFFQVEGGGDAPTEEEGREEGGREGGREDVNVSYGDLVVEDRAERYLPFTPSLFLPPSLPPSLPSIPAPAPRVAQIGQAALQVLAVPRTRTRTRTRKEGRKGGRNG